MTEHNSVSITPDTPQSNTRSRKYATSVEYASEIGFDTRQCKEVPLQLLKACFLGNPNFIG